MSPRDQDLRRREASLAVRERRLAHRERAVDARAAELEYDEIDEALAQLLRRARATARRTRLRLAVLRLAPIAVGLWLMAGPLLVRGEPRHVATAAVAGGAALAFVGLASAHRGFRDAWAAWALGAIGTWILGWAALGDGSGGGRWVLAAAGAAIWLTALAAAAPRRRPAPAIAREATDVIR